MSLDLSQFKDAFFEECEESLDSMEKGLLNLDADTDFNETINTIFRGAHSIKGGAATFGFVEVTEFTHVLETLLDLMRSGERIPDSDDISLLLKSVDWLRNMLVNMQNNEPVDVEGTAHLKGQLESVLADATATSQVNSPATSNTPTFENKEVTEDEFDSLLDNRQSKSEGKTEAGKDQITEDEFDELLEYLQVQKDIQPVLSSEVVKPPPVPEKVSIVQPVKIEKSKSNKVEQSASTESTSIRVNTEKVDALVNLIGELVITQSMLSELGTDYDQTKIERMVDGLAQLERNTRELQESVMRIRMLPISFAFNRLPRLVRDLSQSLGKKIDLKLSGESTELDKTVMEKIGDPLLHLIRNSVDHGIEDEQTRISRGKPGVGLIHLNAYHKGGSIVIEIKDDGAGLNRKKIISKAIEAKLISSADNMTDEAIYELIFRPGFSTAEKVSDVSGRGVGMDVVKRNIKDLGGNVEIKSEEGKGTMFVIRLPLTLAILDGQLIRVGKEVYIIPLVSIVESLQMKKNQLSSIVGSAELYKLRDEYIPVVRMYEVFNCDADNKNLEDGLLVVVEGDDKRVGLLVDELLGQQQVVIKSMETNFRRVEGISGATILGDGTVAIIVDISGLIQLSHSRERHLKAVPNNQNNIKAA
jgi:two-component system, chemotaxis family, sensor kinase CheA